MTNEIKHTKVALIREPGAPQGYCAPMHLNCPCGARPEVECVVVELVTCSCGAVYDSLGYVMQEANEGSTA